MFFGYVAAIVLAVTPTPSDWSYLGAGQHRVLTSEYAEVLGHVYLTRNQGLAPNCTGQALAAAIDIAQGIQGTPLPAPVDASFIYGVSRVDNGKTRGRGTSVSWAVTSASEVGVVLMQDYSLLGVDLTTYSIQRSSDYGSRGPPEALREIASQYKITDYYQIHSWEQLRGALKSGYPVVVGGTIAFGPKRGAVRDSHGYLYSVRSWRQQWRHAQVFVGYEDRPGEKSGALVLNSWGNDWVSGPQRSSYEPGGSYWITPGDVNRLIRSGEAFAVGVLQ